MVSTPLCRKVLVLNDKKSVRNLIFLLKKIESENGLPGAGEPLLALLDQKQFDAVVLDLRCSNRRTREEVRGIGKIRAGRVGKLLVIVTEVNGPQTLVLLERYIFNGLPEALLWLVSHRYKPRQQ
jgi:CheY-like chemotaxis protein